jgi:hypothetical protein
MSTQAISVYSQLGWKIVRLAGIAEPETCTCEKGKDCPTPGKHPLARNWEATATDDEEAIVEWLDMSANIGLLLGPKSGVIDVEWDTDEGKRFAESMKLGELWTPTYTSGRSTHRIFRWSDAMPPVAVKKIHGLEVRIGGGGRSAQSVLPPSIHHTGKRYEWVPGLSPSDVEIQPLPEPLLLMLWNDDGLAEPRKTRPARAIIHKPVTEGGRNDQLYRFACREAFRCIDIDDDIEQQDLLAKIRAINLSSCKPPLSDAEVEAVYRNAVAFVRKADSAGVSERTAMSAVAGAPATSGDGSGASCQATSDDWKQTFTALGLQYRPGRRGKSAKLDWYPGNWRLTVVHSDPMQYRLHVPAFADSMSPPTGNVMLTVDQYRSAPKVAAAVLSATGVIMLDSEPQKWRTIWDGQKDKGADGQPVYYKGLKAKLLECALHEHPGPSSLRYVILAGWLYDRLSQALNPTDDDTPDASGRACWRKDGTLWFSWSRVWEDIERQHRLNEGERLAFKRKMLDVLGGTPEDFQHCVFRHKGGVRKLYVVWTKEQFAALEEMASRVESK